MTTVKEVSISEYKEALYPMWTKHWDMVGEPGGSVDFDLDAERYEELERLGIPRLFVIENDEKILGYAVYLITTSMHSKKDIQAITDSIYVDSAGTLASTGHRLLTGCQNILRDKYKVNVFKFCMNMNYNIEKYMEKKGYTKSEIVYSKRIGD